MSDQKKSGDITVTKNMFDETRNELKSDIASLKLETKSGFQRVDARFDELTSKMETLTVAVHRALALHEEQEARNKYVLDGHQSLSDRQDRIEERYDKEISDIKDLISKSNA